MKCGIHVTEMRFLVEADTASNPVGTWSSFLGIKRPGRGALLYSSAFDNGVLRHSYNLKSCIVLHPVQRLLFLWSQCMRGASVY
jgi:hypothetical protein